MMIIMLLKHIFSLLDTKLFCFCYKMLQKLQITFVKLLVNSQKQDILLLYKLFYDVIL